MSLALTLVALVEVGGLAAIAFLVLNLENLNGALLDVEFVVLLLNLLRLSEDKVLFLFAGLIISYSFLTIVIYRNLYFLSKNILFVISLIKILYLRQKNSGINPLFLELCN